MQVKLILGAGTQREKESGCSFEARTALLYWAENKSAQALQERTVLPCNISVKVTHLKQRAVLQH